VGSFGGSGGLIGGLSTSLTSTVANTTIAANVAGPGGPGGGGQGGSGGNGTGNGAGGAADAGGGGVGGGAVGFFDGDQSPLVHDTISLNLVGAGGLPGTTLAGGGTPNGQVTPGAPGPEGATGGVHGEVGAVMTNTIVASNSGGNCSGITDGGHDLTFGDTTCPGVNADPKLGPLQDNGGPTATEAIPANSPAHDAVPAGGAACESTDQRGVSRPQGPACDIGAFELEFVAGPGTPSASVLPLLPLLPSLSLTGNPKSTAAGDGLVFTVVCASAVPCPIKAVATTTEKLRGTTILSLARKRTKIRKRTVTVASVNLTIAAGATRTITVKLNATGRKLEARFKKLPVTLEVTLIGPSGRSTVVKLAHLTLKPAKKHKRHKKH
jgi:hypothetical protein